MDDKLIIQQYLNVNDYVAIYGWDSTSTEGLVKEIDGYFLHLETETGVRYFRLSMLSSFSIIKKYDPTENDIDLETEHTGNIITYDTQRLTGRILDMTEGYAKKPYFFHLNHINATETELRNLLLVDAWSGVVVHFHLGLNKKGPCAKEITLIDQSELEYSPEQQLAQIYYYSNSGKRGSLLIKNQKGLLPFHIGQVSSDSLVNSLIEGRWKGIQVQFYFAYNEANLCADDIREEDQSQTFDSSQYQRGKVVECVTNQKSFTLQIIDENEKRFVAQQQDIDDLRLFMLARDRWNFNTHPCEILFVPLVFDLRAKSVILDGKMDQLMFDRIKQLMQQWQHKYIDLPRKPTPLSELPPEMIESSVFRRVRTMNKNGHENKAFDLLEQYKDYLNPEKKKNWELVLAAHSKQHDEKLFELLKEDDHQTIKNDVQLSDSEKSLRATHLEMLRDAYYRQGNIERSNEMIDRIDILRFNEDTGISKRCTVEIKTAEHNLKKLICETMPQIWEIMYPDGKGDEQISDWEEGYLFDPPADYNDIYENKKRYNNFIKSHKEKYNENVSLQAVLSLKDVVKLIYHYLEPSWYSQWYTAEHNTEDTDEITDLSIIPCFRKVFANDWKTLNNSLQIITNERDRLNHADANQDPVKLLDTYRKALNCAKEINRFFSQMNVK